MQNQAAGRLNCVVMLLSLFFAPPSRNWVVLDGSHSSDDVNVTSYAWSQVSGPNDAKLDHAGAGHPRVNATGLTKGAYVFRLDVKDELGNGDSADTRVEVKQDTNAAPVARAGRDFEVERATCS